MRGKINVLILNALRNGNKYGLEIIKEIKSITYGQVDIKLPSLYSNLHKLEADGYITSYWENSEIGGKRRYSALTEKGIRYVDEHPFDFSEFKKYENVNKNVSSTLAIQPDFFNTIEHSKKVEEDTPSPTQAEEEIPNYSILDFMNTQQTNQNVETSVVASNTQAVEPDTEQTQKSDFRVYDKTDAVLLSDNEIIPQNESTSLLYKTTTLTNDDLVEDLDDSIDYDELFGEMLDKSDEEEVSQNILKNDIANNENYINPNNSNSNEGILLNPSYKGKYSDQYLSMVSNKSTTQNVLENSNANNILNKPTIQSDEDYYQEQKTKPRTDVDSYLLKDKVQVDDNLKANIFLKRQGYNLSNYDFYNTVSSQKEYHRIEPTIRKVDIFNFDQPQQPEENQVQSEASLTLQDYIENCEQNGIIVQRYRKNTNNIKSNRVYIHKTNLLTSILSFATLIVLMLISYFSFKNSYDLGQITYMVIGIISAGVLYPIIVAIIALQKSHKLVGYYPLKKEWLPRLIVFVVLILLTVAINFFCGLNINNIMDYLPFLCMGIIASTVVYFDYFYKYLLLKFKVFREK